MGYQLLFDNKKFVKPMDKDLKEITYFISFCIEQYMSEKEVNEDDVISIFSKYEVFDYLKDYFDILHTQSKQWIVADIEEYINNKKQIYDSLSWRYRNC